MYAGILSVERAGYHNATIRPGVGVEQHFVSKDNHTTLTI